MEPPVRSRMSRRQARSGHRCRVRRDAGNVEKTPESRGERDRQRHAARADSGANRNVTSRLSGVAFEGTSVPGKGCNGPGRHVRMAFSTLSGNVRSGLDKRAGDCLDNRRVGQASPPHSSQCCMSTLRTRHGLVDVPFEIPNSSENPKPAHTRIAVPLGVEYPARLCGAVDVGESHAITAIKRYAAGLIGSAVVNSIS